MKLEYDELLSNAAFNFNLRRYLMGKGCVVFCMLARDTRVLDKVAEEWEQFHTSHLQSLIGVQDYKEQLQAAVAAATEAATEAGAGDPAAAGLPPPPSLRFADDGEGGESGGAAAAAAGMPSG